MVGHSPLSLCVALSGDCGAIVLLPESLLYVSLFLFACVWVKYFLVVPVEGPYRG